MNGSNKSKINLFKENYSSGSRKPFEQLLQKTNETQGGVLRNVRVNCDDNPKIINLSHEICTETLETLNNLELESTLQNSLYILNEEHKQLLVKEKQAARNLIYAEQVIAEQIKQQLLNEMKTKLQRSNNRYSSCPEEMKLKANEMLELKVKQIAAQEELDSLKHRLSVKAQEWEDIPLDFEQALNLEKELKEELRSLQENVKNAPSQSATEKCSVTNEDSDSS